MASWRELPEGLAPEGRRLVIRMRHLKDRSGLSLSALSRRTSYSSSSWARYLNGQKLPPAQAVEELAEECGDDPHRLLALRSLAEESWDGEAPATEASPAGDPAADEPGPGAVALPHAPARKDAPSAVRSGGGGRRRRPLALALVAALVLAATAVGAVTLRDSGDGGSTAEASSAGATEEADEPPAEQEPEEDHPLGVFPTASAETFSCEVERDPDSGLLGAGYGDSLEVLLQRTIAGWDVVEVQCLLDHHGFSPGTVDGWFGTDTERAVKRYQSETEGLVVDGIVGPHTWGELRG